MFYKILKKIILHFTNPILAIKFDLRKLYFLYSYYYLVKYKKIFLPKTDNLIPADYIDLLNLYKIILNRKPKKVLEVGSGYSTFVILRALNDLKLKKNEKFIFYSLEQDTWYLNEIKSLFHKEDFNILKFIKVDLEIKEINGKEVSICKNFPDDKINFFYEDRADHPKYSIAGDSLMIEENMPDDYSICVDGMSDTVNFLKLNLRRKYKINGGFFHGTNFLAK